MIEYAPEKPRENIIQHIMNNPEIRKKKDNYAKHVINFIEKKGYANNINISNNNINDNYNQEMQLNNNSMNILNNNEEFNNIFINNNIPQEYQFMNNNNLMMQIPGNLGMINNMNDLCLNIDEGQDNLGHN